VNVRAAFTRSLGGLYYDSSFRLEPSQVAGINQAFRSLIPESVSGLVPASSFDTAGAGLDLKIGVSTYFSVDAQWLQSGGVREFGAVETRGLSRNLLVTSIPQRLDYDERSLSFTLTHLADEPWAFSVGYRLLDSKLETQFPNVPLDASVFPDNGQVRDHPPGVSTDLHSLLHQVSLGVLYHHPSGFYSRAEAAWYYQDNSGYSEGMADDHFWQLNLYLGYRFPARVVDLRLGLLNLTDQDYRLAPLNLHADLPRERTLELSLRFSL
jgi:hypothetical protein